MRSSPSSSSAHYVVHMGQFYQIFELSIAIGMQDYDLTVTLSFVKIVWGNIIHRSQIRMIHYNNNRGKGYESTVFQHKSTRLYNHATLWFIHIESEIFIFKLTQIHKGTKFKTFLLPLLEDSMWICPQPNHMAEETRNKKETCQEICQ